MTSATIDIPTIETERLKLVPPAARHLEDYIAFYASDRARFLGGPKPAVEAWRAFATLIGHWTLRGFGRWIVEDKAGGAYLGHAGLLQSLSHKEPELTWSVVASAEGRGFASEAALACRRFAYETLGWTTATSLISEENARSIALAERIGAVFEREDFETFGARVLLYRHPAPENQSTASPEASS